MRVGIYKGSQGRITRQVTFAALALAIALGLYRLSGVLVGWDPIIVAGPARVTPRPRPDIPKPMRRSK